MIIFIYVDVNKTIADVFLQYSSAFVLNNNFLFSDAKQKRKHSWPIFDKCFPNMPVISEFNKRRASMGCQALFKFDTLMFPASTRGTDVYKCECILDHSVIIQILNDFQIIMFFYSFDRTLLHMGMAYWSC